MTSSNHHSESQNTGWASEASRKAEPNEWCAGVSSVSIDHIYRYIDLKILHL